MQALGPRETQPEAWQAWLREGVALLLRQPGCTLAWLLALGALQLMAHQVTWAPLRSLATWYLAALSLVVFIRLALAADHSRRAGLHYVLPANRDCMLGLGVVAVLAAVQTALGPMLAPVLEAFQTAVEGVGIYQPRLEMGVPADPPLAHTLLGPLLVPGGLFGLALAAILAALLLSGQWFALTLQILHAAPLHPSLVVSAQAYPLNPVPMIGVSGLLLIGLGLVVATLGWGGLLVAPLAGALLYTSYRDVFLGRALNRPARPVERASAEDGAPPEP